MAKPSQNNFDVHLIKRLRERMQISQEKMRENEEILRLQSTMEQEMKHDSRKEITKKKSLGKEYRNVMEEKRKKEDNDREREKLNEKESLKKRNNQDEEV